MAQSPSDRCKGPRAATGERRGRSLSATRDGKAVWPQKIRICKQCNLNLRGYFDEVGCRGDTREEMNSDSGVDEAKSLFRRSRSRIRKNRCTSKSCINYQNYEKEAVFSDWESDVQRRKIKRRFEKKIKTRSADLTWGEYLFREKDTVFIQDACRKATKLQQRTVAKKLENIECQEFLWQELLRYQSSWVVPALATQIEMIYEWISVQGKDAVVKMSSAEQCVEEQGRFKLEGEQEELISPDTTQNGINDVSSETWRGQLRVSKCMISEITKHCLCSLLRQFVKHVGLKDSKSYLVSDVLSNRAADHKEYRERKYSTSLLTETRARYMLWNFRVRMGCAVDSVFALYTLPSMAQRLALRTPDKATLVVFSPISCKVDRQRVTHKASIDVPQKQPDLAPVTLESIETPTKVKKMNNNGTYSEQKSHIGKRGPNVAVVNNEHSTEKKKESGITPKVFPKVVSEEKNNTKKNNNVKSNDNSKNTVPTEKQTSKTAFETIGKSKKMDRSLSKTQATGNSQKEMTSKEQQSGSNNQQKNTKKHDLKTEKTNKVASKQSNNKQEMKTNPCRNKDKIEVEKFCSGKKVKADIRGFGGGDAPEKPVPTEPKKHNARKKTKGTNVDNVEPEKSDVKKVQSKKVRESTPVPAHATNASILCEPLAQPPPGNKKSRRSKVEIPREPEPAVKKAVDEKLKSVDSTVPSDKEQADTVVLPHFAERDAPTSPAKNSPKEKDLSAVPEELPPYTEEALEAHVALEKTSSQDRNLNHSILSVSDLSSVYEFDESAPLEDDSLRKVCTLTNLLRRKKNTSCSPRGVLDRGRKKKSLVSLEENRFPKEPGGDTLHEFRKKKKKETGCVIQ